MCSSDLDDIIRLADYPLILDDELGVRTAQVGVGRLHQVDATLIEIPPGGRLPAHRHLAEEIIYIVSGSGYTNMWVQTEDSLHRYDWDAGDLISPSLNTWHQHFNPSADIAAR